MYLIKLKIEMNMADLIVKIVRATSPPPGHELHRYAACSSPQLPRPGQSSNNTNTSNMTTTSGTCVCGGNSQTLSFESPKPTRRASDTPWELKQMPSHFDVQDVVHVQSPPPPPIQQQQQQQQQQQYQQQHQSHQDQRRNTIAEGSISGGSHGLVTLFPVRPALGGRNFSELTQLELGAGYVSKEKRDTLHRESSSQF